MLNIFDRQSEKYLKAYLFHNTIFSTFRKVIKTTIMSEVQKKSMKRAAPAATPSFTMDDHELLRQELNRRKNRIHYASTDEGPSTSKKSKKSYKTIVFYAEKGGVGKTTITSTIGHVLANKGKRVIMYDCDPQRSLTAWCFGKEIKIEHSDDMDKFIDKQKKNDSSVRTFHDQMTYSGIAPTPPPAHAIPVDKDLLLVPGNREIVSLDELISVSETMSKFNLAGTFNIYLNRIHGAFKSTAEEYDADYVLIDLNPMRGILNRRIIALANYLIVPCMADFYGFQVVSSLKQDLELWKEELKVSVDTAKKQNYQYPVIDRDGVKFLGVLINDYHPVNNTHYSDFKNGIVEDEMRRNQQIWLESIISNANKFPILRGSKDRDANILGKIRHYWKLEQLASLFFVPVPFLTKDHAYQYVRIAGADDGGIVIREEEILKSIPSTQWKKNEEQIQRFKEIFTHIVDYILDIIEN